MTLLNSQSTMLHPYRRPIGFVLIVIAASVARPVAAQYGGRDHAPNETASPAIRTRCTAARVKLQAAGPSRDTATNTALRDLAICRESAGLTIPALWRAATEDTAGLKSLMIASSGVRDERIFGAVSAVARDRAKPSLVRQAALIVLASYLDPSIVGSVEPSNLKGETLAISAGNRDHASQQDGIQPIPANARARIGAILSDIGTEQQRTNLGSLARSLKYLAG